MDKRKTEEYLFKQINTERYRKSAIPTLVRMLNEEDFKMKKALNNLDVTRESC